MRISKHYNLSQLKFCLDAAHHFLLSREEAKKISKYVEFVLRDHWDEVCEDALLTKIDKKLLWGRQFLNPFSFEI